jgi:hypothetical protein
VAEGSFAATANANGSKRARWRRRWRQQICWMIYAVQKLKLLLAKWDNSRPKAGGVLVAASIFPSEIGFQPENPR